MIKFIKAVDGRIAQKALEIMLVIFGAVGFVALTLNAAWYAMIACCLVTFVIWCLIYQIIFGLQTLGRKHADTQNAKG